MQRQQQTWRGSQQRAENRAGAFGGYLFGKEAAIRPEVWGSQPFTATGGKSSRSLGGYPFAKAGGHPAHGVGQLVVPQRLAASRSEASRSWLFATSGRSVRAEEQAFSVPRQRGGMLHELSGSAIGSAAARASGYSVRGAATDSRTTSFGCSMISICGIGLPASLSIRNWHASRPIS